MNRKEIGNGRRNDQRCRRWAARPANNSFTELNFNQERLAFRRLSALRQKAVVPVKSVFDTEITSTSKLRGIHPREA
jgi:hypothetical protein